MKLEFKNQDFQPAAAETVRTIRTHPDKEWLQRFDCPLRFIFSHSAQKEGWDNLIVFQVCTLIEQKSSFTCRQKVNRGRLRQTGRDAGLRRFSSSPRVSLLHRSSILYFGTSLIFADSMSDVLIAASMNSMNAVIV